jgi:hypothetical protein
MGVDKRRGNDNEIGEIARDDDGMGKKTLFTCVSTETRQLLFLERIYKIKC